MHEMASRRLGNETVIESVTNQDADTGPYGKEPPPPPSRWRSTHRRGRGFGSNLRDQDNLGSGSRQPQHSVELQRLGGAVSMGIQQTVTTTVVLEERADDDELGKRSSGKGASGRPSLSDSVRSLI
jgi:hypothetical protein